MKYFKQYKDESESFEITEQEAIERLSGYYNDAEHTILPLLRAGQIKKANPLQTMAAFYWAE